jgi:hypothetical protein
VKRIRLEVCPQKTGIRRWKLTKAGHKVADADTQQHAIAAAVTLAKELEKSGQLVTLKIKRRDGTIRDERTYPRSSDPRRSKG